MMLFESGWTENVPAQLLEKVLAGVHQFSPGEQGDDLTLIVGRVR
jgi:hypothetical protein